MKKLLFLLLIPMCANAGEIFYRSNSDTSVTVGPICVPELAGEEYLAVTYATTSLDITIAAAGNGVLTLFDYSGGNIDDGPGDYTWGDPTTSAIEVDDITSGGVLTGCLILSLRDEVMAVSDATEWHISISDGGSTAMDHSAWILDVADSADFQAAAAAANAAYDMPTNAEMEARTVPSADYATDTQVADVDSDVSALTSAVATAQGDLDIVTGTNGVLIDDDAITAAKIAADAIGASEIAADAIGVSEIASNAITTAELADGAITAAKIATDAITSTKIAANAIGSSELATDAIGAAEIAADAIASSELAATAVTEIQTGLATSSAQTTAQNDLDIVTGTNGVLIDDDAITATALAASGSTEIRDAIMQYTLDNGITLEETACYMLSILAGESTFTGGTPDTAVFSDPTGTDVRVTVEYGGTANRTSVTLNAANCGSN